MGITICQKHGERGIRFVCPHIAVSVEAHESLSTYVEVLESIFGEYPLPHGYCVACVKELNLPSDGSAVRVDSDDEAEKIFGPLAPVCGACLAEARERTPFDQSVD
jgi:hypothetical protein